jgi:hypothetical protein
MADRLRRPLFYVPLVAVFLASCWYSFVFYSNYGSPFHSFSDSNVDKNTTLRPRIHFTPDRHWMNDPNGLFVDANNVWHLYYQCKSRIRSSAQIALKSKESRQCFFNFSEFVLILKRLSCWSESRACILGTCNFK